MAGSILLHSGGSSNLSVGMAEGDGDGVSDGRGTEVRVAGRVEIGFTVAVAKGLVARVEDKTIVDVAVSNLVEAHAVIAQVKASKKIKY